MFKRILIANRGEIACRIIRSCRRLGVETVAVASEADRDALHVAMADVAVIIGPAAASESYLDAQKIVQAACDTGAEAIHPGYGFLSENAELVRQCEAKDIVFIGPPLAAIEKMGSKADAKDTMEAAGVPTVPGYQGANQDDKILNQQAGDIGFPLMIKAAAGGGGKGMRIVREETAFANALDSARREAKKAFGDTRMILEKYITTPRHIEVQVFADKNGHTLHLFERDCSSQRRYQKIIEEAPAPGVDHAQRDAMGQAAVDAARAVGYSGAGTVEFIVDADGEFYFMEMNTRLQVEHPVTEMITGLDLVEWQLRVAAGEELAFAQENIVQHGHAIECRIYAEDPESGFLPASGRIERLDWPQAESGLRIDTGVREGDSVSVHYDPMLAKLIVHAEDRDAALAAMRSALHDTALLGIHNNLGFLQRLVSLPRFIEARMDTAYLDQHLDEVLTLAEDELEQAALAAAIALMLGQEQSSREAALATSDPYSPWARADGWRPGHPGKRVLQLVHGESEFHFACFGHDGRYKVQSQDPDGGQPGTEPGRQIVVLGEYWDLDNHGARAPAELEFSCDGHHYRCSIHASTRQLAVVTHRGRQLFTERSPLFEPGSQAAAGNALIAPMPGQVIQLSVSAGDKVTAGQSLLLMEAMKMELSLDAPRDGVVSELHCSVGDFVEADAILLSLEEE